MPDALVEPFHGAVAQLEILHRVGQVARRHLQRVLPVLHVVRRDLWEAGGQKKSLKNEEKKF